MSAASRKIIHHHLGPWPLLGDSPWGITWRDIKGGVRLAKKWRRDVLNGKIMPANAYLEFQRIVKRHGLIKEEVEVVWH